MTGKHELLEAIFVALPFAIEMTKQHCDTFLAMVNNDNADQEGIADEEGNAPQLKTLVLENTKSDKCIVLV